MYVSIGRNLLHMTYVCVPAFVCVGVSPAVGVSHRTSHCVPSTLLYVPASHALPTTDSAIPTALLPAIPLRRATGKRKTLHYTKKPSLRDTLWIVQDVQVSWLRYINMLNYRHHFRVQNLLVHCY